MLRAFVQRSWWFVIFLLITIGTWAQKPYFKVAQDYIKIGVEDYFQVTYIIGNADDIDQFSPPEFTQFEYIAAPSQSQSNSRSIINGKMQVEKSVSVTYTLKPNKVGIYKIKPATVAINNTPYSTAPLTIEVIKGSVAPTTTQRRRHPMDEMMGSPTPARPSQRAQANPQVKEFGKENLKNNIFLRLEVSNEQPYIGQGVQVNYKLYTRLPMNMQLAKLPKYDHFWVEDTPQDQEVKPETKIVNGKEYQVYTIKQSTLYPQQVGTFTLDNVKAEGMVRVLEESRMQDPFGDDFFSDFFGGNPFEEFFGTSVQAVDIPVTLASEAKKITVKPLPLSDQKVAGIGVFELKETIPPSSITTDDVSRWTITLTGTGNLSLLALPDTISHEQAYIVLDQTTDSITQRQPELKGYKTFTYNIIPKQAGTITIPAQAFTFFNTQTAAYYTLSTAPHTISVNEGEGSTMILADELAQNDQLKPIKSNVNWYSIAPWMIGLLIGINILLYVLSKQNWLQKRQQKAQHQSLSKIAISRLQIAKRELDANNTNQFYVEINKALLLYLHDKYQLPISEMSLDRIHQLLDELQISSDLKASFIHLYNYTNQALYMPNANVNAENIYQETAAWITAMEQLKKTKHTNQFVPLVLVGLCMTTYSFAQSDALLHHYEQKEYPKALTAAHEVLAANPNNADVLYNIGLVHRAMLHEDSATYYFQQSLDQKLDRDTYKQLHGNDGILVFFNGITLASIIILSALVVQIILKIKSYAYPYAPLLLKLNIALSIILIIIFSVIQYLILK